MNVNSNFPQSVNESIEKMIFTNQGELASVAALTVENGEISHEGYFGFQDIEAGLKLNRESRFRIASISKLVVTIGVMQLVEQGRIDLEGDVSDYLGFELRNPAFPGSPITLKSILSHTSSIRDADLYYAVPPHKLSDFFLENGSLYDKGAHFDRENPLGYFDYANLNLGVAATVIEAVSGKIFPAYMRDHVFKPLGLKCTFNPIWFTDTEAAKQAVLYRSDDYGKWIPQTDNFQGKAPGFLQFTDEKGKVVQFSPDSQKPGINATLCSPQGGLRISAVELSVIMRSLIGKGAQVVSRESVTKMFTPVWEYDDDRKNGRITPEGEAPGTFVSAGLGTHIFTNNRLKGACDRLHPVKSPDLAGHLGVAYGLFAGFFLNISEKNGFIYIIGGTPAENRLKPGKFSGNIRAREELSTLLIDTFRS